MNLQKQIKEYIATQPEPKRSEMQQLHHFILALMPTCKLWFLDGKDEKGKTVSNPNIGYGSQTIKYTNGKTKEFYQIGISANTTGISVYIMGLDSAEFAVSITLRSPVNSNEYRSACIASGFSSVWGPIGKTRKILGWPSGGRLRQPVLMVGVPDSWCGASF